ncbi:MAG: DUF4476 domain-containing protein [Chitinophagales bacterium]
MTTSILIFCTVLISQAAIFANVVMSELRIVDPQNEFFAVQLNNAAFTNVANEHIFENIRPGNHNIKLANMQQDRFGNRQFSIFANQQIHIRPATRNIAVINAFNELVIVFSEQIRTRLHVPVNYEPVTPQPVHPVGVSDYDFIQFLAIVERQSFESTKLNMMRNFIRQNDLNSYQVKSLMHALTFESSRLEIAKLAFGNILDPNNYYLVNDAFQFESSIRQLNRALYG